MNYKILVNKDNKLKRSYQPKHLIEIHEPMGKKLESNYINKLNKKAYKYFKLMQKAALKKGYKIYIDSSYRTYKYQLQVFNDCVKEKGIEHTKKFVAAPGASEHQTALSIDIIFMRDDKMIEEQKEDDPEIIWLNQNAHQYGYILRYPKNKEKITGVNFEPWHFRFCTVKLAKYLYKNNLTLEEYYNNKRKQ